MYAVAAVKSIGLSKGINKIKHFFKSLYVSLELINKIFIAGRIKLDG